MTRVVSVAGALALLTVGTVGQEPVRRNFVACPIVQDTKTVPCWMSESEGELYYLGIQTDISADFHPPYLGHQVLVEGIVSTEPRVCGGVVLKPVRVSPIARSFFLPGNGPGAGVWASNCELKTMAAIIRGRERIIWSLVWTARDQPL